MTNDTKKEDGNGAEGEGDVDLDLNDGDEGADEGDDKKPEKKDDDKDGKSAESPEAKSARLARMQDRHDKKHGLGKYKSDSDKKPSAKSDELDYGQLAFLAAKGIDDDAEVEFVQKAMKDTGKSLKDVLKASWFQAELKELKEFNRTKAATPKGTKRSNQSTADTVEYWIAKGELPPADQRELRIKVVNAKMKKQQDSNVFTNNPVIGNYK